MPSREVRVFFLKVSVFPILEHEYELSTCFLIFSPFEIWALPSRMAVKFTNRLKKKRESVDASKCFINVVDLFIGDLKEFRQEVSFYPKKSCARAVGL